MATPECALNGAILALYGAINGPCFLFLLKSFTGVSYINWTWSSKLYKALCGSVPVSIIR
jgi:hypothetical protein